MTGEGVVAFVEIVEIVVAIVEIVVAEGAVQGNKESKYSCSGFPTQLGATESNYLSATLILGIPKSGRQRTRYTPSQRKRSDSIR